MGRVDKTFKWCLKRGEKEVKHRGLKKIERDIENSDKQIGKAESDLETM